MARIWRGRLAIAAVVLVSVAILYGTATNTANGDSYLSFPAAQSLVHQRNLDLDEFGPPVSGAYFVRSTDDGHLVDYFPWPVALVAVPSVAALDVAHAVGVGPGSEGVIRDQQMTYVQMGNGILATLAAVLVVLALAFALADGEERHRRRVAVTVAVAFALGTSAWSVTSRANWLHGPSMALSGLAVLAAARLAAGRSAARWGLLLGAGMAAAYAMRPTNLAIAGTLTVWLLVTQRRALGWTALGGAAVLVPWMAVNQAVWGQLVDPYHDTGRASLGGNLGERMATQLVSPGRGLLLFSPIVLVAVPGWWMAVRGRPSARRLPFGLAMVLAAACGAHWVAASSQDFDWWGGVTFGPRFMADCLPWLAALSVPAVSWLWAAGPTPARTAVRSLAVATLVWSCFVHAQGAYLRPTICWNFEPNVDEHRIWDWSDPQLLAGVRAIGSAPIGTLLTEPCAQQDVS